jgi:branched-chain amino acid transport system substrate-binding protein
MKINGGGSIMKKSVFSVALAVSALLLLVFFSQVGAADKPPVKIGYIASITGPVAVKVADMTRGVQLAVAEINRKGGILGGRKVQLLTYDAKSTPEEAVTAARKAISADHVNAIVGFDEASLALAAKPVIMKAKIPMMVTMAIHSDLVRKPGEVGFFSSAPAAAQLVTAQIKFDQDVLKIKSAVVIGPDVAFFWGNVDAIKKNWDRPGSPVKILDVVAFPMGSPDITAAVLKAAGPKPDLIWSWAWGITDNIQFYKQLSEVGYTGYRQQCLGMLIPPVLEGAGKAAEGAYGLTTWGPELTNPESEAFKKAVVKEFGPKAGMSDVTENGYTGTMAVLLAMNKAGTVTDVAAISKACENLNWISPRGYRWEVDKDGIGIYRELTIVQSRDGKPIPLVKIPR